MESNDRVLLRDIPLQVRVGCTEAEREAPQRIYVDVDLGCDVARAAKQDDLHLAVDYVQVRNQVAGVASNRAFALVETLAERIAFALLERFPVLHARVRVKKPGALAEFGVPWAGVEVVRRRRG